MLLLLLFVSYLYLLLKGKPYGTCMTKNFQFTITSLQRLLWTKLHLEYFTRDKQDIIKIYFPAFETKCINKKTT